MEPENGGFRKESPVPGTDLPFSMLNFRGVFVCKDAYTFCRSDRSFWLRSFRSGPPQLEQLEPL